MSKKAIFYTLFFVALSLGFYLFLQAKIPFFGKKGLPPIGNVQPFTFINQDGKTITEKDIAGKVAVVNFFFTTCKTVCPIMATNLLPVYKQFGGASNFIMLSHTSDPERDSVPTLKRYADSLQVQAGKWLFLTGRKDSLYAAARHSYKIDDPANFVQNIDDDFLHSQFIALVNKKGEVIKIYDGIKPSEVKEMETDIAKLLKE